MPPTIARIRRVLGRTLARGWGGRRPRGMVGGHPAYVVPLTVRGTTYDGADVRLLLEATVATGPAGNPAGNPAGGAAGADRATLALLVPAARRWLATHPVGRLRGELAGVPTLLHDEVRDELAELGVRLLRVDVVAVEHLLASPSADGMPGVDADGER